MAETHGKVSFEYDFDFDFECDYDFDFDCPVTPSPAFFQLIKRADGGAGEAAHDMGADHRRFEYRFLDLSKTAVPSARSKVLRLIVTKSKS